MTHKGAWQTGLGTCPTYCRACSSSVDVAYSSAAAFRLASAVSSSCSSRFPMTVCFSRAIASATALAPRAWSSCESGAR